MHKSDASISTADVQRIPTMCRFALFLWLSVSNKWPGRKVYRVKLSCHVTLELKTRSTNIDIVKIQYNETLYLNFVKELVQDSLLSLYTDFDVEHFHILLITVTLTLRSKSAKYTPGDTYIVSLIGHY